MRTLIILVISVLTLSTIVFGQFEFMPSYKRGFHMTSEMPKMVFKETSERFSNTIYYTMPLEDFNLPKEAGVAEIEMEINLHQSGFDTLFAELKFIFVEKSIQGTATRNWWRESLTEQFGAPDDVHRGCIKWRFHSTDTDEDMLVSLCYYGVYIKPIFGT